MRIRTGVCETIPFGFIESKEKRRSAKNMTNDEVGAISLYSPCCNLILTKRVSNQIGLISTSNPPEQR